MNVQRTCCEDILDDDAVSCLKDKRSTVRLHRFYIFFRVFLMRARRCLCASVVAEWDFSRLRDVKGWPKPGIFMFQSFSRTSCTSFTSRVLLLRCFAIWHAEVTTESMKSSAICNRASSTSSSSCSQGSISLTNSWRRCLFNMTTGGVAWSWLPLALPTECPVELKEPAWLWFWLFIVMSFEVIDDNQAKSRTDDSFCSKTEMDDRQRTRPVALSRNWKSNFFIPIDIECPALQTKNKILWKTIHSLQSAVYILIDILRLEKRRIPSHYLSISSKESSQLEKLKKLFVMQCLEMTATASYESCFEWRREIKKKRKTLKEETADFNASPSRRDFFRTRTCYACHLLVVVVELPVTQATRQRLMPKNGARGRSTWKVLKESKIKLSWLPKVFRVTVEECLLLHREVSTKDGCEDYRVKSLSSVSHDDDGDNTWTHVRRRHDDRLSFRSSFTEETSTQVSFSSPTEVGSRNLWQSSVGYQQRDWTRGESFCLIFQNYLLLFFHSLSLSYVVVILLTREKELCQANTKSMKVNVSTKKEMKKRSKDIRTSLWCRPLHFVSQ